MFVHMTEVLSHLFPDILMSLTGFLADWFPLIPLYNDFLRQDVCIVQVMNYFHHHRQILRTATAKLLKKTKMGLHQKYIFNRLCLVPLYNDALCTVSYHLGQDVGVVITKICPCNIHEEIFSSVKIENFIMKI